MTAIDIRGPVEELCEVLGVHPDYVAEMTITPSTVDVTLYRGRDGRCKGPKFCFDARQIRMDHGPGGQSSPAMEQLRFEVTT